ncbi:MAG: hypothetical protein M2R45_04809 [Verrucomicrobia subdivision 3 bacterium]|nr:hypothetical protein [Limisphaerales bacterium]MCS1417302.1 hypothetical protein [Limisphaerales bacterium]
MNEWPDFQLPDDWSLVRMDELATKLKAGGTPSRKNKDFFGGDIPFVLIDDMTSSGVYLESTNETITQAGLDACSAWMVPENTVLLSMYATIGATVITTFPVATNQAILAIIPREGCDREYLSFCLQAHKAHLARLNVESTQKNINKGIVSSFAVPLPPLPEQKKIAHILSTVQRAIEAQERIIQTTTELFKTMLHQLMTAQIRVTERGYISGKFGKNHNANGWEVKPLGDILKLNYGKSLLAKNRIPGRIPVYGSNGIVGTHNTPMVDEPGLIVGRKGSAGQIWQSFGPFYPIDTTFYITKKDAPKIDLEFLYYLLLHLDLTRIIGDVGIPGLNREMAYLEEAYFPSKLSEQKKIALTLSTIQKKIDNTQSKKQKFQSLFRTLLHEMMTAKTRVHSLATVEGGAV